MVKYDTFICLIIQSYPPLSPEAICADNALIHISQQLPNTTHSDKAKISTCVSFWHLLHHQVLPTNSRHAPLTPKKCILKMHAFKFTWIIHHTFTWNLIKSSEWLHSLGSEQGVRASFFRRLGSDLIMIFQIEGVWSLKNTLNNFCYHNW